MAALVITQAQLIRALPDLDKKNLNEFVASFNMWAVHFGIDTPKRAVMFLSECIHETGYLKSTEENMNYSADGLMRTWPNRFKTKEFAAQYARQPEKIGNYVYANRMGNGPEESGDGWKYRGRGYIGLTGKNMFQKYSATEWCVGDAVEHPEIVSKYPENMKSAMWFWMEHNLNDCADRCDIEKCSRIINGGNLGMASRKFVYRRLCKEFAINTSNNFGL